MALRPRLGGVSTAVRWSASGLHGGRGKRQQMALADLAYGTTAEQCHRPFKLGAKDGDSLRYARFAASRQAIEIGLPD